MVAQAPRDTRAYEHFFLQNVEIEESSHTEAEQQRASTNGGAAADPAVLSFLDEVAAGAVKKVRFREKGIMKGQYMSLARIAAWRGLYLERIPDRDDDLTCYIRKRADSDEKARQRAEERAARAAQGLPRRRTAQDAS